MPLASGVLPLMLALQATQATVAGTVRNADTGEPIAGAVVALADLRRSTTTDAGGRYALAIVPAGPQHITARFIGYASHTLHALVPADGRLQIDIALRPVPVQLPPIHVRTPVEVPGLGSGPASAWADRRLSMAAVRNHPLLAEPDAFQALGGGEVALRPEAPGGLHVRGGASDQTAYLLNGVPVLNPFHAAGLFSAWNPDALGGLELSGSVPPPGAPAALSGVVSGETLTPGDQVRVRGTATTTHAGATMDGPLGGGVGYLVSGRAGHPGLLAPKREPSYLRGETGDWLAVLEAPVLGGRLRLMGYQGENELSASAAAGSDSATTGRNRFAWGNFSLGAEWRRTTAGRAWRVLAWGASADAGSAWWGGQGRARLGSHRQDHGLQADVEFRSARSATVVGARLDLVATDLRVASDSTLPWRPGAQTRTATVFAQHDRMLGSGLALGVGLSLAAAVDGLHPAPRAVLRWAARPDLTLAGSVARLHQFIQSVRNPESVVGTVFPADLYLAAGAAGVPVARSDQAVLSAEYRPAAGLRLGAQAYVRSFDGLLLVAPDEGGPFATARAASGEGTAHGFALNAALSARHLGVVASYGYQRVRYRQGPARYVPEHAAGHVFEAGLIVFPTATTSLRLGLAGALDRRATAVAGGFEWESCNLIDRGCEFAGGPVAGSVPGGTALPAYWRVDLGFRKHWHLDLGSRHVQVALFGTITNLLNRQNVLTQVVDPATGTRTAITMRPRAPLVAGLEWQF